MPVVDDNRIALIAVDTLLGVAWYWVVLRLAARPERFLQTTTAIFGYQTILAPALGAATWLFVQYMQDPVWQVPVALVLFALAIWTLSVNGRILRAATGWPQFSCVALVLLQAFVSRFIELGLFPGQVTS
jgi:hypothetical protein